MQQWCIAKLRSTFRFRLRRIYRVTANRIISLSPTDHPPHSHPHIIQKAPPAPGKQELTNLSYSLLPRREYDQHRQLVAHEPPRVPWRAAPAAPEIVPRSSVLQQRVHEEVEQVSLGLVEVELELNAISRRVRLRSQEPVAAYHQEDVVDAGLAVAECEACPCLHRLLLRLHLALLHVGQFLSFSFRLHVVLRVQLGFLVLLLVRVACEIDHCVISIGVLSRRR